MSKRAKQYQGYHTHPSQDSSVKTLEDGTILVAHRIDKREKIRKNVLTQSLCRMPRGGSGHM